MTAMQRTKGKAGEREIAALIAALTGWDVRRRVRQHDGDSDLTGIPGWAAEVKRHKAAPRAQIARWWAQAEAQATQASAAPEDAPTAQMRPVLFYRSDRADWRAVWPLAAHLAPADAWPGYAWTVEGTVDAWAAVARDAARGVEA